MKIVVERELDISSLYRSILYQMEEFRACEEAMLGADDFTPERMNEIFKELADYALTYTKEAEDA